MADSSGNGYTLTSMGSPTQSTDVPSGIGSTGSAYFNETIGGADMLYTTAALPLSNYTMVKITWWQKILDTCTSCVMLETKRTGYSSVPAGIGVIANSTSPKDGSNTYAVAEGGGTTTRNTFNHVDEVWEKYSVVYDLDNEVRADQIVVLNEAGTIVDDLPYWDGNNYNWDPKLPFDDFAFHIGARGDHVDAPYAGMDGYMDNIVIEGYVPEPASAIMLATMLLTVLGYRPRRQ